MASARPGAAEQPPESREDASVARHPASVAFVSDVDYDDWEGQIDAEALYMAFGHAYRCPESGHLWVFDRGYEHEPRCHAPLPRGYTPNVSAVA